MTDQSECDLTYRDKLRLWAPALIGLQGMNRVYEALGPGCSPAGLKLFAEGNFSKRREKLQAQLEFVAEAFDGFQDLVSLYLSSIPPSAYDTTASDGERFLSWLERTNELTARQRDYLSCQRARLAVEAAARADRRGHLRYQELWNSAPQQAAKLETEPGLLICLNPSRAWTRFLTLELLDDDVTLPADLMFFAAGETIRTAVLEPHGKALIEELAVWSPCTLDEWAVLSRHADRYELAELCRDLAEMGLVALKTPIRGAV